MKIYAIADVKHGLMLWNVVFGCILRDLFPDPDSALYLTNSSQAEFVKGLSTLVLESLIGTEIHPDRLKHAQSREDLVDSLRYRTSSGDLSKHPPTRVRILRALLSPWPNLTHGGCRYLRVARVDTLRKVKEIRSLFLERRLVSPYSTWTSVRSRSSMSSWCCRRTTACSRRLRSERWLLDGAGSVCPVIPSLYPT